jgi:hypothetical protein
MGYCLFRVTNLVLQEYLRHVEEEKTHDRKRTSYMHYISYLIHWAQYIAMKIPRSVLQSSTQSSKAKKEWWLRVIKFHKTQNETNLAMLYIYRCECFRIATIQIQEH